MKLVEDFNDPPSLVFSTASQVVIMIWNRDDMVRSIKQFLINRNERMWREIEIRVKRIVGSIGGIPINLVRHMNNLITPIGFLIISIKHFVHFSPNVASSDLEFPVSYWTSYGTVDTKRLEEMLMLDNTKDISFRYTLACNDCIETVIKELFPLLTDLQKVIFLELRRNRELLSYWTHRLSENLPSFKNLISPLDQNVREYSADQLAFKYTLVNGSKSGIEYFLNYLQPDQSKIVLKDCFLFLALGPMLDPILAGYLPLRPPEHYTDALYFLFPKLDEDQRSKFLRECPFLILKNFLMYPFYGLFCKYVNISIRNFTEENVSYLLRNILYREALGENFFGYEPFKSVWCQCSETQKNYFLGQLNELNQ